MFKVVLTVLPHDIWTEFLLISNENRDKNITYGVISSSNTKFSEVKSREFYSRQ